MRIEGDQNAPFIHSRVGGGSDSAHSDTRSSQARPQGAANVNSAREIHTGPTTSCVLQKKNNGNIFSDEILSQTIK